MWDDGWDDPRSMRHFEDDGSVPPAPVPTGQRSARRRRVRLTGNDIDAARFGVPYADDSTDPPVAGTPRITLPSQAAHPRAEAGAWGGRGGRRRGLGSRLGERLSHRRQPANSWEEYADGEGDWNAPEWSSTYGDDLGDADEPGASGARARERTAARPVTAQQRALISSKRQVARRTPPPEILGDPLLAAALPTASVPDLVAFHPVPGLLARLPVRTRAVIERASRPWSLARLVGVIVIIVVAVVVSLSAAGEGALPAFAFQAAAGTTLAAAVDANVVPITQLLRCDEYDSMSQCQAYGNASCSAAAMTEVFTAWGVQNITIGRVIDELGPDISPNGGLLTHQGFERVAVMHNFRADIRTNLTYNQILYIVNNLGWPLITDVRISYGYYYFLAGGHFLVATGGNADGLRITDSSEYYIHYLPKSVFYSMFTGSTVLLVPQGAEYTLPND